VLGLAAPGVDAQERGLLVAPLTVLLDPLGRQPLVASAAWAGVGRDPANSLLKAATNRRGRQG
jgi:hypothetical protein